MSVGGDGGRSHEAKAKETMEVAGSIISYIDSSPNEPPESESARAARAAVSSYTAVLTRTRNRIGPSELQFLVTTAVVTRRWNRPGPSGLQFLVTTAVGSRNRN